MTTQVYRHCGHINRPPKNILPDDTDLQMKNFLSQPGHSGFSSPWWAFLTWIYPAIFLADTNI